MIELVITMVVIGIVATALSPIITQFINAYDAQLRRGGLVERAQIALNRITREVHLALPNSIRVNAGNTAMEMIRTLDGGRYRAQDDPDTVPVELSLDEFQADADGIFDVLGPLNNCTAIKASGGGVFLTMMNQQPGSGNGDAYQNLNLAVVTDCDVAVDGFSSQITFTPFGAFASYSTMRKFQIVDTPVSYICFPDAGNPANGRIIRYHGYSIAAAQPTTDAAVDALRLGEYTHDILIDKVAACEFNVDYNVTGDGLLTVSITIQDETTNELVRLMQQVQVLNSS